MPASFAPLAVEWLSHACAADPRFQSNEVHSVYFDTPALDSLSEKENSEYLKRKVRLRWYTNPDGRPHLEVKAKEGARSWKNRIPVPCDTARLASDPMGTVASIHLPQWAHAVGCPLHDLQPACVIHYVRRRFIEMSTGTRVALDTAIRASHLNPLLLGPREPHTPTVCILELKGPRAHGLPPVLSPLCRFGLRRTSFSKYAECLQT